MSDAMRACVIFLALSSYIADIIVTFHHTAPFFKTKKAPSVPDFRIVFADGVSGRCAKVAGSGLDVWEVIANYKSVEQDFKRLETVYHWLTQQQLRSAIGYYFTYRNEIDELITRNNFWTSKSVLDRYPYLKGVGM